MINYKKFLKLAKTCSKPNKPHIIKFPFDKEYDKKPVLKWIHFMYELWEEDEMMPEQLEVRNMFREGLIPNPFPIFTLEEAELV